MKKISPFLYAFMVFTMLLVSCQVLPTPAEAPSVPVEPAAQAAPAVNAAQVESAVSSGPLKFITYNIKEETSSDAGYKDIKIYFQIENNSPEWIYFNSFEEVTLKTDEGYSSSEGPKCVDSTLLSPGMVVQETNGNCYGEDSPQQYLGFTIGLTLNPSTIEFNYFYQPVDEKGGKYNSPVIKSDVVSINIKNLGTKGSIPFSKKVDTRSLPVSYNTPSGTLTFNSVRFDQIDQHLLVDLSATSSDPGKDNYVFLKASLVTSEGAVIRSVLDDGTISQWGVGPLQTLNDSLDFYFSNKSQMKGPYYLLFPGFTFGDDDQLVEQIILLNP